MFIEPIDLNLVVSKAGITVLASLILDVLLLGDAVLSYLGIYGAAWSGLII